MKKGLKIALIVLFGLIVTIVAGTELALNSRIATNVIDKISANLIDGTLGHGRLRVSLWRSFPMLKLSFEDLSLCYPSDRFEHRAGPNSLYTAGAASDSAAESSATRPNADKESSLGASAKGTGAALDCPADTLLSLRMLSLRTDVLKALKGEIQVEDLRFEGLRLYAHAYPEGEANWQIFKTEEDSSQTDLSFLKSIVVDTLRFDDAAIVYTSLSDSLSGKASIGSLRVAASASFPGGNLQIDSAAMSLDSKLTFETSSVSLPSAKLLLAANASQSGPELGVSLTKMDFSAPGLRLSLDAEAQDLLGSNPKYELNAALSTAVAKLYKIVPSISEIAEADGDLRLALNAKTSQAEINSLRFEKSKISGKIESDALTFAMSSDTLSAELLRTKLELSAKPEGLKVDIVFDSVYFAQGAALAARLKGFASSAQISKSEFRGQTLPVVSLDAASKGAFVRSGASRFALRDLGLNLSARRKPEFVLRDSLRRARSGLRRDSLLAARGMRGDSLRRPAYEQQFDNDVLDISLDSSLVAYFRQWSPSGHIEAGSGFFSSPQLPLRTRLTALKADFSERNATVDTLSLYCGTSDLSAKGGVRGLWRALSRKGRIEGNLDIDSKRLNINELLSALAMGAASDIDAAAVADEDESFVVDSLAEVPANQALPLIVVPANLDLTLALKADRVDYADFEIAPLTTGVKIRERTLQLTDTDVTTNLGKIGLSAFYSTKSKEDISAGVDLRLSEMQAHDLIELLPTVDDLMPALRSFHGLLGCEISGTAKLDTAMNVIMPSVDALVRVTGRELEVKDAGSLRKLTRLLLFKNKNIGKIDNLQVDALVRDSRVELFPFELSADRYAFALRGTQNLDGTMLYHASVLRSPFLIPFGINIYGTLDNWRFSLCRAKYRSGKVAVFSQQIDSVQVNLAKSIRNIFQRGVDNVMLHNASSARGFVMDEPQSAGMLAAGDFSTIEDALLAEELKEQETALAAEVEAVLAATAIDSAKLLEEYQKSIYDAQLDKKIRLLKRQSERKKK